MAYFEQFKQLDGTTLFSGTISATGAGTVIDTQYYGSVSIQIGGTAASITAQVEGSNDQSNWDPVLLHSSSDLAITDTISSIDDTYTLKAGHRYIRLKTAYYTGTPSVIMIGRSGAGPSAADNLTAAFNPDTPLNVNLTGGLKTDSDKALILSEKTISIGPFSTAGQFATIDVSGYSSFIFQPSFGASGLTLSTSTDGAIFYSGPPTVFINSMLNSGIGTSISSGSNGGIYYGIITGKYLRFTAVAVALTGGILILKQSVSPISIVRLQDINGSAPASTGVGGMLAVGGATVIGAATAVYPLTVGGTDLTGLVRRLQTDVSGRAFFNALSPYFNSLANNTSTVISSSNSPIANTALPINTVGSIPATYQQSAALNVQETSQYEGQNLTELLAQILLEMRIMNQQLYELPRLIATNQASSDPPETFRQEPSIFTI